jgi:hypothetical protein
MERAGGLKMGGRVVAESTFDESERAESEKPSIR